MSIPYVVGQWVRDSRFYGRSSQITEILDGPRDSLWVLGTRRIGKTSLLRQLEWLAREDPERRYLPLFWDLQGADTPKELDSSFREALLDAEDILEAADLRSSELDNRDLFADLRRLQESAHDRGLTLLLLCDEVEELVQLQEQDPDLLPKLGETLSSPPQPRTVLASTVRLEALAGDESGDRSFLGPFHPRTYLAALSDSEARNLIGQSNLDPEQRPEIPGEISDEIRKQCGNHPFLLHLLSKRYLELGEVEAAVEAVATDRMVSQFFQVDWEILAPSQQKVLLALASHTSTALELAERADLDEKEMEDALSLLQGLGLVERDVASRLALTNPFFQHWLEKLSRSARPDLPGASPDELLELVYRELRRLAGHYMSHERPDHTLQPTALVHEAYLRLSDRSQIDWRGRSHFFALGAQAMRRVLIDHARGHRRAKRGGDWLRVTFTEGALPSPDRDLDSVQLLSLNRALDELAKIDARQARVVELRYFAGLTVTEVAEVLGVSKRTVEGDWTKARKWLEDALADTFT